VNGRILLIILLVCLKQSYAQIITTIAGNSGYGGVGTGGFSGDGGKADTAKLNEPFDLTFDTKGNLYFSDGVNNRVRMINTAGIITTISGLYNQQATSLNYAIDIANLSPGVYTMEISNTHHKVLKKFFKQ
jgi:hypothetical protein